jgi:hypothetical protein
MLTFLMLVACGDKDGDSAVAPTHYVDIQPIWEASCAVGCHTEGSASGDLALDEGYSALVGVESSLAGINQVEPGSLADSYLWLKLEGSHEDVGGEGSKMPLGNSLSDEDLALISTWIEDGAPQ